MGCLCQSMKYVHNINFGAFKKMTSREEIVSSDEKLGKKYMDQIGRKEISLELSCQKTTLKNNSYMWNETFLANSEKQFYESELNFSISFPEDFTNHYIGLSDEELESSFEDLNSSSRMEEDKIENLSKEYQQTTGTYSCTNTECQKNQENQSGRRKKRSQNFCSQQLKLQGQELLAIQRKYSSIKYLVENSCEVKPETASQKQNESVYLKKNEVKVQLMATHIFIKYRNYAIEVNSLMLSFLFQQFLSRGIIIPLVQLDKIPKKWWTGLTQLLVTLLNENYDATFKQILSTDWKSSPQESPRKKTFFSFLSNMSGSNYSKSQLLIKNFEQQIKCLQIMGEQFSQIIAEQKRKIEHLWLMTSIQDAEQYLNSKKKQNIKSDSLKKQKAQLLQMRDMWICSHFSDVQV